MGSTFLPPKATKKWRQLNQGDEFGELFGTFNIDLHSRPGKIKPSPKTYRLYDNADDSDFGKVPAIIRTAADATDRWWAVAGSVLFKSTNSSANSAFAQDAIGTTPTDLSHLYSDMVEFESALLVSTSTDIHRLASGTWDQNWWQTTRSQAALTSAIFHPLHVFNRLLLIGDANMVHVVDRNNNVSNSRLTFDPSLYVVNIRSSANKVWITTRHIRGGTALIFEWDGTSETYNSWHSAKSSQCLSLVMKDGVPYVLNTLGQLLKYAGSGFAEVGFFPCYKQQQHDNNGSSAVVVWRDAFTPSLTVGPNGMTVIEERIHILASGALSGGYNDVLENMYGGIWVFDDDTGLHHKFALSSYKSGTVIEYGTGALSYTGALVSTTRETGYFLAGASLYTDNGTTERNCLFIRADDDSKLRIGYFITSKINASKIEELWGVIWQKFQKLRATTDVIVVKKRNNQDYRFPFRATVTWTSTTTLTSTQSQLANATTGNEIEVFMGIGAGMSAHISSITEAGGTYTIVLDEAVSGATSTGIVRVNSWIKVGAFSDSSSANILTNYFPLGDNNPWLQFKVEMRGLQLSPEIEELEISSTVNTEVIQ